MPKTYFDEDGAEHELPTQEELKELQEKAEKAGGLDKFIKLEADLRKALDVDEKTDLTKAVKEAKEAANPNWPKTRAKLERMETFIKGNFKEAKIKDDGEVELEEKIDLKTVEERAKKAAIETILGNEINKHLQKYPENERQVVKKYFEKLTNGEELNSDNIETFVLQSASAAGLGTKHNSGFNLEGGIPKLDIKPGENFAETEQGQKAANQMFGDESFAKKGDA